MSMFQATDSDSGKLGQIEYRLVPDETGVSEYFAIDPTSGNIRTKRTIDIAPKNMLPLRITVEAKDNPQAQDSNSIRTQVVVSIVYTDNFLLSQYPLFSTVL